MRGRTNTWLRALTQRGKRDRSARSDLADVALLGSARARASRTPQCPIGCRSTHGLAVVQDPLPPKSDAARVVIVRQPLHGEATLLPARERAHHVQVVEALRPPRRHQALG